MKTAGKNREKEFNKIRFDYMRERQNLKNALALSTTATNRNQAEALKLAKEVYNFNDLEGLEPELVAFFNEKL